MVIVGVVIGVLWVGTLALIVALASRAKEDPADRWERNIAQPAVLERYREAAPRARETKMDRDVREAIEAAER